MQRAVEKLSAKAIGAIALSFLRVPTALGLKFKIKSKL